MTANAGMIAVGVDDHRHRVPADITFNPPFQLAVARIGRFIARRDGVHVRGTDQPWQVESLGPRVAQHPPQHLWDPVGFLRVHHHLQHAFQQLGAAPRLAALVRHRPIIQGGIRCGIYFWHR